MDNSSFGGNITISNIFDRCNLLKSQEIPAVNNVL